MHKLQITPTVLNGKVMIPTSKSVSHRAIIAAGLAKGISRISNVILSEDIVSTMTGMEALGVSIKVMDSIEEGEPVTLEVQGNPNLRIVNHTIDCRESGSTLRFLIPLACLSEGEVTFTGQGKLVERPLDAYYEIFQEQGLYYQNTEGFLPLTVHGSMKPGIFKLKGNVSSQFITGLMFSLPLLKGDSKIIITTEMESKGYVDLTIDVLKKFGVTIQNNNYREFLVTGNQRYTNRDYEIEGDYSQAAFWIVAGIIGENITSLGLNSHSLQGDKAILEITKAMGADLRITAEEVEARGTRTRGTVIDASQCPDLVPVLAVLGALSKGTTKIINAERLRIKESDRLKAISTELNKLGAKITELPDGLLIEGVEELTGGTVDSWNDHRIAMAMAVASQRSSGALTITGSNAVNKSYPHFWKDFIKLGGKIDERSMG